jgi:hypothetical protein
MIRTDAGEDAHRRDVVAVLRAAGRRRMNFLTSAPERR